jgi:hypothetical protein
MVNANWHATSVVGQLSPLWSTFTGLLFYPRLHTSLQFHFHRVLLRFWVLQFSRFCFCRFLLSLSHYTSRCLFIYRSCWCWSALMKWTVLNKDQSRKLVPQNHIKQGISVFLTMRLTFPKGWSRRRIAGWTQCKHSCHVFKRACIPPAMQEKRVN